MSTESRELLDHIHTARMDGMNDAQRGYHNALADANAEIHVWRCLLTTLAIQEARNAGVPLEKIGAYIVQEIALAMWATNESGGFAEDIDITDEGDELERMEAAVDRACDKLRLPRLESDEWSKIIGEVTK